MAMYSPKIPIDFHAVFDAAPGPYLLLAVDLPHFTIVAVNEAYLQATLTEREGPRGIVGRGLFDVFPDKPGDVLATGKQNLLRSLQLVIEKRQPHTMAVQKYDIPWPAQDGSGFQERYWSPVNTPVFNHEKELVQIIHHVEDVTELAKLARQNELKEADTMVLRTRNAWLETEITRRQDAEAELGRKSALRNPRKTD
jgi:PAS domain-containing protein